VISRPRGVAELLAAAILFGFMAYLAKQTNASLDGAETALVRFVVGAGVFATGVALRGRPLRVVRRDLLVLRGLLGGIAVLLFFISIAHLPVGTATLLNYTAPIFTTTFSAIFLAEKVPAGSLAALAMASTGVALVVYGQGRALGGGYVWLALGLVSAVTSGAAVTAIRAARRSDGAWEVFGIFCLAGALCTGPFALHAWKWPTSTVWLLLVAVGLLAAAGQLLMTHALIAVEASTAGIISQITVVTAMALGHFLDGEPFREVSLVGAALTVAGVSLVSTGPQKRAMIAR